MQGGWLGCPGIHNLPGETTVAHPLVRDIVFSVVDLGDSVRNAIARKWGSMPCKAPPRSNMKRTSSPSLQHYIETGISTSRPIQEAVSQAGLTLGKDSAILDLGAGVGRQLRLMQLQYPDAEIHACDVEPNHVRWLANAFPEVDCRVNEPGQPLGYPSGQFDLIYSIATFTHLDPEIAARFIADIERLLKPGGVACLSVLGADEAGDFSRWLSAADLELLNDQGFHYVSYDIEASRAIARKRRWLKETEYLSNCGDSYGQTFYRRGYIEQNWQRATLAVAEIQCAKVAGLQDLVIMRKV